MKSPVLCGLWGMRFDGLEPSISKIGEIGNYLVNSGDSLLN